MRGDLKQLQECITVVTLTGNHPVILVKSFIHAFNAAKTFLYQVLFQ